MAIVVNDCKKAINFYKHQRNENPFNEDFILKTKIFWELDDNETKYLESELKKFMKENYENSCIRNQ